MSRFVIESVRRDTAKACHIVRGLHAGSCSRGAADFLERLEAAADKLNQRDLQITAEFSKLQCGLEHPDHEYSCQMGVDHAHALTARRLRERGILK